MFKPYEELTVGDFAGLQVEEIRKQLDQYKDRHPTRREIFERANQIAQQAAKDIFKH